MAYLEENEWMFINEITYNIHYIYSIDDMRKKVLNWLNVLLNYDGAVFSFINHDSNELIDSVGFSIEDKYLKIFEKKYLLKSPVSWMVKSGKTAAFKESDVLSQESIMSNDFYKEFYAPNRFFYSMYMNIVFRDEVIGLISIFNRKEKKDFTNRDIFIIGQLQKHLAYRLFYEEKKGDTRYFYAKGYHDRICREFNLTTRESEILSYAVKGLSNEEISEIMNISVHTVKKHFHSLYIKMNVKNRIQLLQSLPLSTNKLNLDEI